MPSRTALFALLALWGVGLGGALPARAEDLVENLPAEAKAEVGLAPAGLVNRVWRQIDDSHMPGIIRIFLSDGTLVMDSCWETHRLFDWQPVGERGLTWNEDGRDVNAKITHLSGDSLTLVLELKGGPVEEHYRAAPVPSICPDMPKA